MIPETKELFSSHIPALQVLISMGYTYLPPEIAMKQRGGNRGEVLLQEVLIGELRKRRFNRKGKEYPLSNNAIDDIVRQLASPGLGEGLLTANEQIYDQLTLGITVTEFIDGKKAQPTIPVIDWNHMENNQFHATDEFEVLNTAGTGLRREGVYLVNELGKKDDPSDWSEERHETKPTSSAPGSRKLSSRIFRMTLMPRKSSLNYWKKRLKKLRRSLTIPTSSMPCSRTWKNR